MKTLHCIALFSFVLISITGNSQNNSDKIPKDHFELIQDFFDTYNKNDKNSISSFAQASFNETFLGYGLEGQAGWFSGNFYKTDELQYLFFF
ncbi:MAG: hypothetical protein HUJ25_13970, partial [Crocinitomicaceae bacterium]|nr:hypothetical protein [Crocinitomicaceae bacterium]